MDVGDALAVLDRMVAELVGAAVDEAAPDSAARLQILEQAGHRLIDLGGEIGVIGLEGGGGIPRAGCAVAVDD